MNFFYEKLANLFGLSGEQIVEKMEKFYKDNSEAEKKSWRISLPKLIGVVEKAGLGNLYMVTEYELPAGGRIDAVLLGADVQGRQHALIVELKQWSFEGVCYDGRYGFPSIIVRAAEPYHARHPVAQTDEYLAALKSNHSNAVNGSLLLDACQYLHDFQSSEKAFFSQALFSEVDTSKMYFKNEEEAFAEYLKSVFTANTDGQTALELFLKGAYVTTELDMEIINKITESPDNIPLWHDQTNIMDHISFLLKQQAKGALTGKHMLVISGAAGTGKTIVGFRVLAEYWRLHPHAQNNYKCQYALPQSRTIKQVLDGLCNEQKGIRPVFLNYVRDNLDVLVVDEAHRVTDRGQITRLIDCAQLIVILQDDKQRVRGGEIGTRLTYKEMAYAYQNSSSNPKHVECQYAQFSLNYQKRAGLGSYVDRLDKLLYGTTYAKDVGLGLDIKVEDSLQAMEAEMKAYYENTKSVKYFAPYCWEWKSRQASDKIDIIIDDDGYSFQKQWNPMYQQYDWYLDSLDKVGCIYTAQGLGFDYVGFIWWDDLVWRTDHWEYRIDKVTRYDYMLKNSSDELLLNIYRVMLTRAKKGLLVWFKDEETKQHFKDVIGV